MIERYILKSPEQHGYRTMVVRDRFAAATLLIEPNGDASQIIGLHYSAAPYKAQHIQWMVEEFDEPGTRAQAVLRFMDRVEREIMECPHTEGGYCFPDTSMSQPELVHASMSERWRALEGWVQ